MATKAKAKTETRSKTKVSKKAAKKPAAKKKTKAAPKKAAAKKKAVAKKASAKKTAPKSAAAKKTPAKKATPAKPSSKRPEAPLKSRSPKKGITPPPKGSKPLKREFMIAVAQAIKDAVEPSVRAIKGREVVGQATSGDATFQIDQLAERALLSFLRDARMPVAYYSEDSGYTTFTTGQPQHLLVVDPIDGTRAAKSGFESCVVSVASTRIIERPRIGDVDQGCVMEILGNRTFYAERGKGARIYLESTFRKPRLSPNTNLELMTWTMTVPARPAELIFPTAAKLIDLSSLKGGFFACNSTSFSLTRLLTQQLDACVDLANRYYRDIKDAVEDSFINAGRGNVLGVAPYDIAASLLIAEEAGCIVTDAYGKPLHNVMLLDSGVGNLQSLVASSNEELHEKLLNFFDTRIRQYEQLLTRKAQMMKQMGS